MFVRISKNKSLRDQASEAERIETEDWNYGIKYVFEIVEFLEQTTRYLHVVAQILYETIDQDL